MHMRWLCLLLLVPTVAVAGYVGDPLGRVTESTGAIERLRGTAYQSAPAGAEVAVGDRVTAREHSLAKVLVRDKYTVTIRELSTVTFSAEALDLTSGTARVKYTHYSLTPLPVRTQIAIASIRGSDGIFELRGDTLVVTGIDGQIDLCKEVIQRFDQVIATKTCQVSKRRMPVSEWAAYIAWSETSTRVSDLTWKSLVPLAQPSGLTGTLLTPPMIPTEEAVRASQFRRQFHRQHQSPSDGPSGED